MGFLPMLSKNASVVKLSSSGTPSDESPTQQPSSPTTTKTEVPTTKPAPTRRLSLRPFALGSKHKPALAEVQEHEKKVSAANAFTKQRLKSSNSDKRAKEFAMILRTLIVGPTNDYAVPQVSKAVARPQLSKVKSELIKPHSANKVIAQLRALPLLDEKAKACPSGPIHAVCLAHPDAEEHELHFAKLTEESEDATETLVPNGARTSLQKLASTFNEMHIVDLVTAPDLGLGQPGDGKGLLAGAIPTAESVLNGFEQITPQLMALGYATGKAILPDHKGVHPPTDRMSVLTYWWGLEIVLPPPTLAYLSVSVLWSLNSISHSDPSQNTKSIAGTLVNFLTALSLVNNGVREILPFVRYISQFIDFEFNMIKAQDQGQGVVCASTWIMPAALVSTMPGNKIVFQAFERFLDLGTFRVQSHLARKKSTMTRFMLLRVPALHSLSRCSRNRLTTPKRHVPLYPVLRSRRHLVLHRSSSSTIANPR
ncbi:hypothetical protein C8F01DRAFT_1044885 [Mycena amicta]|nr:hypothetical protein C8F01DRAFT_1044885 [Mycena amicta]